MSVYRPRPILVSTSPPPHDPKQPWPVRSRRSECRETTVTGFDSFFWLLFCTSSYLHRYSLIGNKYPVFCEINFKRQQVWSDRVKIDHIGTYQVKADWLKIVKIRTDQVRTYWVRIDQIITNRVMTDQVRIHQIWLGPLKSDRGKTD